MSINSNQSSQSYYAGAAELLVGMESLLLKLNVSKPSLEIFNVIFLAANSIKGGAVSCGFNDIVEISQILEALVDKLRKRELSPTDEMVKILLKAWLFALPVSRPLQRRSAYASLEVFACSVAAPLYCPRAPAEAHPFWRGKMRAAPVFCTPHSLRRYLPRPRQCARPTAWR